MPTPPTLAAVGAAKADAAELLPELELVELADSLVDSGNAVLSKSDWRIEVTNRGKYYIYRKGSKQARRTLRGGYFAQLPESRQSEYYRNVARRSRHTAGTLAGVTG